MMFQSDFTNILQTRLKISQPGDKYEQEADRVADHVMRSTSESVQMQPLEEEEELQMKPDLQLKSDQAVEASPELSSKIESSKGNGSGLTPDVRQEMSSKIGADFSDVNIHTDSKSVQMNQELGARAFTQGSDIYFNSGEYNPSSSEGKHLLAHELTHVVQQDASSKFIQTEKIRYRNLKWSDFHQEMAEENEHDASTFAGVNYSRNKGAISWGRDGGKATDSGREYEVTISYNSSKVSMYSFMWQEKSSKKKWLTDDNAAKKRLGEDANLRKERSKLLKHEQLHFKMAKKIAEIYQSDLENAVPSTPYKKTIVVENAEKADEKAIEILNKKSEELDKKLNDVVDNALDELGEIQDIYDVETDHSQIKDEQKKWQDKFDEKFKKAREKLKKDEASENNEEDTSDSE